MRRRRFLRTGALALGGAAGVSWVGATGNAAAQTQQFEPLGTLQIDGLAEVVADESGTVAYGALRDGFVVVDVSDPTAPTELTRVTGILADAANGPVHEIFDLDVSGDRLLVAGPRHGPGRDDASGFEVYDVSAPERPRRLGAAETDHGIHNAFLDGETAFLTGTGAQREPLVIYDVSGDEPAEVSRWSVERAAPAWEPVPTTFRTCHDVYVQDDVAFVAYWDAGTWLLDVSDPANPVAIAGLGGVPPESLPRSTGRGFPSMLRELPGNSHFAQPSPDGSLLAVGKEAWDDEETDVDGGPGGIEIWDVSDTSAPTRLTILAPPAEDHTSHNFGWRGDRLYTSWYGGGVRVFDLGDPADPTVLAGWADEETTAFWTAKPATDAVVASSYVDPREDREDRFNGVGATLYTFPEPGDSAGSTAETVTPRPTPRVTETATSPGPNTRTTAPAVTTDSSPTPSGTEPPAGTGESPTGGTAETTDGTGGEVSGGGAPGFGILATLAAGGIAAWRLAARRPENPE
jgi:hypothetical protein